MFRITDLKQPVLGISPMDGVTDSAMRYITKKYGNPDVIYTEFTHVHGLCVAGDKLLHHFRYDPIERPIIAQIYGKEPEYFYHAAKMVCALGFDGLDINMGCPAKTVEQSGSGAALIRTPELAKEIVLACKKGVQDWVKTGELTGLTSRTREAVDEMIQKNLKKHENYTGEKTIGYRNLMTNKKDTDGNLKSEREEISVSVKTRIGYDSPITAQWISTICEAKPEWLAVHGRTLKQLYTGNADWNELKIAVETADVPVLVNGDIKTKEDFETVTQLTGAYGALVGRALYGNPWVFEEFRGKEIKHSFEDIKKVIIEHTEKFVEEVPDPKGFFQMRKHLSWYISGIENATELRIKLMQATSLEDVKRILN
jgi:tRNA-dihydrouridine synthase